jgi:hypothetical protein
MSYQTEVEICVRVIGYSLAGMVGIGIAVVGSHLPNLAFGLAFAVATGIGGVLAIQRLMDGLREWADI